MQANCTKCKKDITRLVNLYFEGKIKTPKCNCEESLIEERGGIPLTKNYHLNKSTTFTN